MIEPPESKRVALLCLNAPKGGSLDGRKAMQVDGKDKEKVCALVQNFAILGKDKKQEVPVMRLQIHKIDQKGKKLVSKKAPLTRGFKV